ncbi:MAG: anthranilate synthase component I [Deltaproteobacteria bacterium]|nr:anthranilate synthase component I [Deltaproteobacteria bacterium]
MAIKPSFKEFTKTLTRGNLIPVYEEFLADTETPVSTYLKIRDDSYSYLLESADGGLRWGRYSFIGYRPFLRVLAKGDDVEVWQGDHKETFHGIKNPLFVLRDLTKMFRPVTIHGLPPFQGGLVGYVNYDLIRKWERLPCISPDNKTLPETIFIACRRLIVFDHFTHMIQVIAFAHVIDDEDPKEVYDRTCQEVQETMQELQRPLTGLLKTDSLSLAELESNFNKEDFKEAVKKAKEHIVAGDIIQVVLSQRFSGKVAGDEFDLYRYLRSVNPSPYMFYLNFHETKLIGASPEILVRLTDNKIELRPIAGTRARGRTPEEDKALEHELLEDPKERAEHIMLVDLGRNDVGKVAAPGTVTVPALMEIERYSHVMHIVSRVEGTLKKGMDAFDLFMSAFPAGTVSGAPKIRAMEIISELEPTARGPYAGAVGYFGFNGNMDFCITIRTITIENNKLYIQVGAGIVADSSPEGEYEETLRKAGAMFRAIERVKENDSPH